MSNRIVMVITLSLLMVMQIFAAGHNEANSEIVNIYSHRHYPIDKMLFDGFQESTGIKVNVVQASADELIERMLSEREASPADLLFTVDAGRLIRAKKKGLLSAVESEELRESIPRHLRDTEGYWYGLTKRARVIVWDKERIKQPEVSSYDDLANTNMKGKILIRSSSNIYNVSLLSFLIKTYGGNDAVEWATGVVDNMARPPQGNDRDQMKALVAGVGDYAVVNTYYVGLLLNSSDPEEVRVGKRIGIIFPDQETGGTHINISGAGIAANAPNRENALKLLEYMASPRGQQILSQKNFEYPANPQTPLSPVVESWGRFKESTTGLSEMAAEASMATRIFDTVQWR